jgi:NADPH-dependent 2,4-dienoyl-CoA reductase/sulfur reductase-like enzyme
VVRGEEHRPYNRTTVNKALLQGLVSVEAVTLPEADTPGVEWTDASHAVALDTARRVVTLASGASLTYEGLIIASGSSPRHFPGDASDDVHGRVLTLRTASDTARLRRLLTEIGDRRNGDAAAVTILGAGLIGTETASVLTAAGARVHLVSRSDAPMTEHLGQVTGQHLAALHRRHVTAFFGDTVTEAHLARSEPVPNAGSPSDTAGTRALEAPDQVVATLATGRQLRSDILLVSIGVIPNTSWLRGSGLDTADGVAVDSRFRARGATDVYAAGDVARITDDDGRGHRIEHWNHAAAQGRHAALALLHDAGVISEDPGSFDHVPSYSTQLYGSRITVVGHPRTFAHETVVDGDPASGRFTVALTDDKHRIVGAIGVGGAKHANALKDAIHGNEAIARVTSADR